MKTEEGRRSSSVFPFIGAMYSRLKLSCFALMFMSVLCLNGHGQSAGSGQPTDYVLLPSDLIRVVIYKQDELTREVRITQEYTITLPLVGTVDLKDKTLRQAEEVIRALYNKDYIVNPQINITVVEYTPRTVQVVGSVNSPGVIEFPPERKMGLVEAIARAGGQSRIADLKRVRLTRTNAEGKTENFTINIEDMMKGVSGEQWLLNKGDVVFVPERFL